jgi:glycerol-3-phosphate O-acyltransferase / dihydroxyacetone phosphate acyltransferase
MIYYVFGVIIKGFYQMFYKRVYIQGQENIPVGKPVLLAANHSNGLLDPLLIAIFLLKRRAIYFLARADIFSNKFLVWLFDQVHMRPIYRPRDGADYVEKNDRIFDEVNGWLLTKKAVLIFSEGSSEIVKRLRPLKKGTVRMGFRAWEDGADVYIVPTGINYTYHCKQRSEVIISYGKPMRLEDYRASFNENPAKAYREANRDLFQRIQDELIIIDKTENEDITEQMLIVGRNDFPEPRFPIMAQNPRRLAYEQRITRKINTADTADLAILKEKANHYFESLKSLNTTDNAVKNYQQANSFIILLLAPLAKLLSLVLHLPINYLKKIASKLTIKDKSMFMTMWTGLTIAFYVVLGLLWGILGTAFLGLIMGIGTLIIFIFLTYWSGVILEIRQIDKANSDLENIAIQSPEKVKALEAMRLELSKWIRS